MSVFNIRYGHDMVTMNNANMLLFLYQVKKMLREKRERRKKQRKRQKKDWELALLTITHKHMITKQNWMVRLPSVPAVHADNAASN